MLKKPAGYDDIQLNEDFTPIELGGHKGVIMSAEEYTSEISGNTSLRVCVDTSKDDKQPSYFTDLYNNGNNNGEKKWSNSAIKFVSLKNDENCIRMLKSFITAVENSNPGFTYDWGKDTMQLKGKKVGLVFGWEEYQDQEGKTKTGTKLTQFRSIDKVDSIKIPKVKLLDGTFVDFEEYQNNKKTNEVISNVFNGNVEIDDTTPFEI